MISAGSGRTAAAPNASVVTRARPLFSAIGTASSSLFAVDFLAQPVRALLALILCMCSCISLGYNAIDVSSSVSARGLACRRRQHVPLSRAFVSVKLALTLQSRLCSKACSKHPTARVLSHFGYLQSAVCRGEARQRSPAPFPISGPRISVIEPHAAVCVPFILYHLILFLVHRHPIDRLSCCAKAFACPISGPTSARCACENLFRNLPACRVQKQLALFNVTLCHSITKCFQLAVIRYRV